jgi:hypothetical protein
MTFISFIKNTESHFLDHFNLNFKAVPFLMFINSLEEERYLISEREDFFFMLRLFFSKLNI